MKRSRFPFNIVRREKPAFFFFAEKRIEEKTNDVGGGDIFWRNRYLDNQLWKLTLRSLMKLPRRSLNMLEPFSTLFKPSDGLFSFLKEHEKGVE